MLTKLKNLINQINNSNLATYDKRTHYAVPKGKYLLTRRQDKNYDLIGDFENSIDTYDKLWGEQSLLSNYLEESRLSFLNEVAIKSLDLIEGKRNASIVDIGTGPGELLKIINSLAADKNINLSITGTDYSPAGIELCKKLLPNGVFLVQDVQNIEFKDNSFDLVFCMEVLEHIEFPAKVVIDLYRICKPGGFVIITIPNGEKDTWLGHLNFWSMSQFINELNPYNLFSSDYVENGNAMLFILCKK